MESRKNTPWSGHMYHLDGKGTGTLFIAYLLSNSDATIAEKWLIGT